MAGTVAPNIVTDGLVLYLDAANTKSYVSGSTTCINIATGQTGLLNNGPTFSTIANGAIVTDGTDDTVTISFLWNRDNFSISWFMYPTDTTNWTPAFAVNGWGDFTWHSTAEGSIYAGTDVNQRLTPASAGCGANVVPKNVWQNWTCTFASNGNNTNGVFKMYKNGIYVNQATTLYPTTSTSTQTFTIGRNMNLSICFAYNKTLSADEILQNYNTLKPRFGL